MFTFHITCGLKFSSEWITLLMCQPAKGRPLLGLACGNEDGWCLLVFNVWFQLGEENVKCRYLLAPSITIAALHCFLDVDKFAFYFPPLLHTLFHLQTNVSCNFFPQIVCYPEIFIILQWEVVKVLISSDFLWLPYTPLHTNSGPSPSPLTLNTELLRLVYIYIFIYILLYFSL